ncbi:hypothetical protein D1610_02120 [Sphingomonas gilva]|uniref:Flagellar motor switch protein FliN-like C-terminal domain-containing protein n=2 Tax=Sphingomonas gilva TaxID=2305907 RepID=A0A396S6B8_9SPHN|nr:hypothetical protein D1610_02120 [Sphingomonas gilva]
MVRDWSRTWFAGESFAVTRPLAPRPKVRLRQALCWQSVDEGIALNWADHLPHSVAARMLGWESLPATLGENDLAVLDRLADACLDDLKRRCRRLANLPEDGAWSNAPVDGPDRYEMEIGIAGGGMPIAIVMTAECFARVARHHLDAPPRKALRDGRSALSTLSVGVSAHVGSCRVSLADLEQLAAGDVLILDRGAKDPLPLAVDRARLPSGRCVVVPRDGGLDLKITEALMG